jgi:hypothetical protein
MRFIQESTRGVTPNTPAFSPIRNSGTTLGLSKTSIQSEEIRDDRQLVDFRHGAYQVGGDIKADLSYGSFDAMLEAALCGTWTPDTPSAGTDQLSTGVLRRYFTIERYFADILTANKPFHRFYGCEFSALALQVNADAIVKATFSVLGAGMASDTVIIPGATYADPSTTTPFDSFSGTLTEGGSQLAVITEIQVNINNGHNPRFVVGAKESIMPSIARSNCSGQITAFFEDSVLLDKFISEVESSIEFTLVDLAGNAYAIKLPRIKYTGGQPDVNGEGPITLSMPFQAMYDSVTGSNIFIERTPA